MRGCIDIHSHILPGIDDGAGTKEISLKMLKTAYEHGTRQMIATPHFHYRRGHALPEKIHSLVQEMQEAADSEGLDIRLYPGSELYYTHELLETVKAGGALTMAGSDYVLLEFSPDTEPRKIRNAVYEFLNEGYFPIIAHMERYRAFEKNIDFAGEILQMGAYFQVNAGSLMGKAGWGTKRFSRNVLKQGMIHFIGTDAHDLKERIPELQTSAEWIKKKYGSEEAADYFRNYPLMILENKTL